MIETRTHIPTAVVPAPRHPSWCDHRLCRTDRSGDVVHAAAFTWRVQSGQQINLRLTQDHEAGTPQADPPGILIEIPTDRDGTLGILNPAEARVVAARLLDYALDAVGE